MIAGTIAGSGRYVALHRGFAAAFEFLRRPDLAAHGGSRHEI